MKKLINKIIICTVSAFFVTSCTDLSEDVYSKIALEELLSTEKGVLMNAGRAYTKLHRYPEEQRLWSLMENASDELVIPGKDNGDWWEQGRWDQLNTHKFDPTNKILRQSWEFVFEGISGCNEVLYETQMSMFTFEGKDKIIAEIKILRCLFYYWGVDNWGNIPFTIDYTDKNKPKQQNRKFIYNYLVNEIKENLPKLQAQPTLDYYGRVTKGMAFTLLAKIYLNAEEWIGEKKYIEANSACDSVIALNAYKIEDDYFTNFKIKNETSLENIFVIPYNSLYTKDRFYWYTLTLNEASQATFNFIGQPWDGFVLEPDFFNKYNENDKRRKSFLFGQQYDKSGNPIYFINGKDTTKFIYTPTIGDYKARKKWEGARCCKYEYQIGLEYNVNDMENDFVLFRYADILYTKLEALYRLKRTDEFINNPELQKIRIRAGLMPYTTTEITDSEFIDELGREFAWEGHRRQDQIRFGTWGNSWWVKPTSKPDAKLFPIPKTELDKNPNLTQNPMDY